MRIGRFDYRSPRQNFETFCRGMTLRTEGPNLIGAFRLFPFVFELTDEATPAHMAEEGPWPA